MNTLRSYILEIRFRVLTGWILFCLMFVGCSFQASFFGESGALKRAEERTKVVPQKPVKIGTAQGVPIYTTEVDGVMYYMVPVEDKKVDKPFNPFEHAEKPQKDKEL